MSTKSVTSTVTVTHIPTKLKSHQFLLVVFVRTHRHTHRHTDGQHWNHFMLRHFAGTPGNKFNHRKILVQGFLKISGVIIFYWWFCWLKQSIKMV